MDLMIMSGPVNVSGNGGKRQEFLYLFKNFFIILKLTPTT